MRSFFSTDQPQISDALSDTRVRYTQFLALFAVIGSVLGLLAAAVTPSTGSEQTISRLLLIAPFLLVNLGVLWLIQKRRFRLAAAIIIVEFIAGSVTTVSAEYHWLLLTAMIGIIGAATLAPSWLFVLYNFIIIVIISFITLQQIASGVAVSDPTPSLVLLLTVLIVGFSTRYFITQAANAAARVRRNRDLLEAAAEIGQVIGKLLNLNDVLPRAVDLIRERFDFYHVQVFLVDESSRNARLIASTGEIGRKLLEREHSLPVGSQSVIGQASASGKAVLARDTDPTHRRNELLPLTRAELGLPIFDGDKIIGVLDVQSQSHDAFNVEVVQALLVLANLLGTSIRNARLFEAQEASARESKRLFLEAETNLREVQRLNQQLNQSAWNTYLNRPRQSSGITIADDEVTHDATWSETLRKASLSQHVVSEIRDGHRVIAVPMMLGNQVVGAIEVEADSGYQDGEVTDLVNAVSQRLAISLDKARLFEESQEATIREQQINQIVARYQTVNNVDDLLRITLQELSQSLGATRAAIRLGTVPVAHSNGDGHS